MNSEIATYIGYSASLFIVLSFIVNDVRKMRVINMIGCVCFVTYGIFNGMLWPVIIPNALICLIQIYYLFMKKNN